MNAIGTRLKQRWLWPAIGALALPLAAMAADAPTQYFIKKPAGTLTYNIVLTGRYDKASPAGTPVKQQFHDIATIHRSIEVTATLFRVPAKTDPGCGRACGDDWHDRALAGVQQLVARRCGDDAACRFKTSAAELNAIMLAGSLQDWANRGLTWGQMQPCTATVTVDDSETLTAYVYADDAGTDKDPGTVTRSGKQTGSARNVSCKSVFDPSYQIFLTVPRDEHGYLLELPPFSIPTVITRTDALPGSNFAGAAVSDLAAEKLLLGKLSPLPLPAMGQPFSGRLSIGTLFKAESTPVFQNNALIPVSAEITWRFTPSAPVSGGLRAAGEN